jgi:hypothetical protein
VVWFLFFGKCSLADGQNEAIAFSAIFMTSRQHAMRPLSGKVVPFLRGDEEMSHRSGFIFSLAAMGAVSSCPKPALPLAAITGHGMNQAPPSNRLFERGVERD